MKKYNIVLSAGVCNISTSMTPYEGLSPVCGKPTIYWTLSCLKTLENTIVVVSQENIKLQAYLTSLYPQIKQVLIQANTTILDSLKAGLSTIENDCNIQLILGDTYVEKIQDSSADCFYVSDNIYDSQSWCIVETYPNSIIKNFIDKKNDDNLPIKKALIGLYKFSSSKLLKSCVYEAILEGCCQLSCAFKIYNKDKSIRTINTKEWIDLGHIRGLLKAKKKFISHTAREFNSMQLIEHLGIIEKISTKKAKLADEILWYKSLPEKLKILAPRIIEFEETKDYSKISMELYGYSSLSELFVYGDCKFEQWRKIIDSLFTVHKLLENYKAPSDSNIDFEKIYIKKTQLRLNELMQGSISSMLENEYIYINGVKYKNLPLLKNDIITNIKEKLLNKSQSTVIHGDYCFSNILFDPNFYIFKLIDPRGSFSQVGIYGDPRYDIAKLRHSIIGLYDFIIARLFSVSKNGQDSYDFKINAVGINKNISIYFDKTLQKYGFDLNEIKLIEALLFLTMIPLHSDSIERQMAFYLTSIIKLNTI